MTIRRFASTLLRFSIRHASPASREWGEAMLREMDFVKGDWAALGWAIQSAVTLLLRRGHPGGASDLMAGITELARKTQRRTWGGALACVIVGIAFCRDFHLYSNPLQRIGCGLMVVAAAYMLIQLYKGRGAHLPDGATADHFRFYQAELRRQRDFHRGGWLWSRLFLLVPGFLLFCIGEAAADPLHLRRSIWAGSAFTILWLIAVPNNLKLARKYQRKLDELDASDHPPS